MNEYEIRCSRTWREGTRINCESFSVTVMAESEEEVRAIVKEEEPDFTIDSIKFLGEVE